MILYVLWGYPFSTLLLIIDFLLLHYFLLHVLLLRQRFLLLLDNLFLFLLLLALSSSSLVLSDLVPIIFWLLNILLLVLFLSFLLIFDFLLLFIFFIDLKSHHLQLFNVLIVNLELFRPEFCQRFWLALQLAFFSSLLSKLHSQSYHLDVIGTQSFEIACVFREVLHLDEG